MPSSAFRLMLGEVEVFTDFRALADELSWRSTARFTFGIWQGRRMQSVGFLGEWSNCS
jgi:hypothetical protein